MATAFVPVHAQNRLPALETFLAENRYTYTALGSIDKFAVLAITPATGK